MCRPSLLRELHGGNVGTTLATQRAESPGDSLLSSLILNPMAILSKTALAKLTARFEPINQRLTPV